MSGKLRLIEESDLPASWQLASLGNFLRRKSKTFNPVKAPNETWELYSVPSHETGRPEIARSEVIGSNKQFVGIGDVLLSKINPRLNRSWVVGDYSRNEKIASTEWIVFEKSPKILSGYLKYALSDIRVRDFMAHNASGVGGSLTRVKPGLMDSIYIGLPPIDEQNSILSKIESLLSELDKGIESLKTAREQLKVYRQAVLKHAFEGKLTAQWREENKDKLESPEQLLTRIPVPSQPRGGREASREVIEGIGALAVNKPKKNVPEGWVWTPLLRVARQETGHTPSRRKPEYWGGDQYWIGIVDARLHHGQKINDTLQKVTSEGLENSSARILPSETVCLSRTASVGYVCIMGKPMATSQDFATWSCTEALDSKFLMYAIIAEGSEIRRFGKGTTHTTIYFPEIRALHIALPSVTEQRTIVDLLEKKLQYVDLVLNDIDEQILRTETLRQSILKKAFTGQLATKTEDQEST